MLDVKGAVRAAKDHVADVFADEDIRHLGLEEVEHDDVSRQWRVTLGFSRPWNIVQDPASTLAGDISRRRTCKIVVLRDSGKVVAVRHRETEGGQEPVRHLAAADAGLQAVNDNHLREQRPDFR